MATSCLEEILNLPDERSHPGLEFADRLFRQPANSMIALPVVRLDHLVRPETASKCSDERVLVWVRDRDGWQMGHIMVIKLGPGYGVIRTKSSIGSKVDDRVVTLQGGTPVHVWRRDVNEFVVVALPEAMVGLIEAREIP